MAAPGTILDGKYVVERVLGEGGMGMVVAAVHKDLGHRVAIKMMLPHAAEHPEMLARFEREARARPEHRKRAATDVERRGELRLRGRVVVERFRRCVADRSRALCSEVTARDTAPAVVGQFDYA